MAQSRLVMSESSSCYSSSCTLCSTAWRRSVNPTCKTVTIWVNVVCLLRMRGSHRVATVVVYLLGIMHDLRLVKVHVGGVNILMSSISSRLSLSHYENQTGRPIYIHLHPIRRKSINFKVATHHLVVLLSLFQYINNLFYGLNMKLIYHRYQHPLLKLYP